MPATNRKRRLDRILAELRELGHECAIEESDHGGATVVLLGESASRPVTNEEILFAPPSTLAYFIGRDLELRSKEGRPNASRPRETP